MKHLILASTSTARQSILKNAGLKFTVMEPTIDEIQLQRTAINKSARELALYLAEQKAQSITLSNAYILGADQTLECEGRVFHKPKNLAQAKAQLTFLRGKTHTLHSAVAITHNNLVHDRFTQPVSLTMRTFTDAFLDDYIANADNKILSSVGAYQIEGHGAQLFSHIEGDYFTILGLPLLPLLEIFRKAGILPS